MKNKKHFIVLIIMLFSLGALSQVVPPPVPPPPPPGLPIDNIFGLSFLVASGLIYAIFKLKK